MPRVPLIHRRVVLPFVLAVVLAGEVSGLAMAVRAQPLPAVASTPDVASVGYSQVEPATQRIARNAAPIRPVVASEVKPTSTSTAGSSTAGGAAITTPVTALAASAYRGRNHVWMPALGIDRAISSFPCSRSRPPDNYVYRWGCAGTNNVYLLGHAYSVFKPLHDPYTSGRLAKGMKVFYADNAGDVQAYAVIWWKVTRPTTAASWAWAAQTRPSMTLQTCLGANSEYRLIVRLVAVD